MVSPNDVEWKSVFEEGTLHRTFEITVEGKSFFVNPSFLAERSSFFETLLFGDFKEKKEGKAEKLKDVKAKDFEEFLLVLGADPKKKKKVEARNFATIANFSHLWDVETLREECIQSICSDTSYQKVDNDVKTAIDNCCACERIKAPMNAQKLMAARLARFSVNVLAENGAHEQLSSRLSTAVFVAAQKGHGCAASASAAKPSAPQCCNVGCKQTNVREIDMDYFKFCPAHYAEASEWHSKKAATANNVKVNLLHTVVESDQVNDVVIDDIFFPAELA